MSLKSEIKKAVVLLTTYNFKPHLQLYPQSIINVKAADLQDRRTKLKNLRRLAVELSYRYSNYKQKEFGAIFGGDYCIVSQN